MIMFLREVMLNGEKEIKGFILRWVKIWIKEGEIWFKGCGKNLKVVYKIELVSLEILVYFLGIINCSIE